METILTLESAKRALIGHPLVFGDERQIEAVRLVEAASELIDMCKDSTVECPECEGEGVTECGECGHEDDCEECHGKGELKFSERDLMRCSLAIIQEKIAHARKLQRA